MLSPLTGQTSEAPLPPGMPPLDPATDICPDACRRLWAAVMGEAWRQAFHPNCLEYPAHVAAARRWFGGRDFCMVCALLEIDPKDMMAAFHRAVREGAAKQPIRVRG